MRKKITLLTKTMLLLCALVVGSGSAWATDYSYTFSSQQYTAAGAKTLNDVSWTMAGTGGSYFGYDSNKGQQFGSGSKPYSVVSLTTSGISGTITSVAVNTSGANSISGTVAVSVGGTDFKCNSKTTASLTSTATDYTFTNNGASGDVVISWAQTSSKAIYVKSITVTYSSGGGGSEPNISLGSYTVNAPETAVSTTSIEVTYNNLTNLDADVIFYEADGTTAATYDHSWINAEINTTTMNLDYSITANTGAARTAYLKVYALGDEGEAESSLITITQAKKTVAAPEFSLETGTYIQGVTFTLTSAGNTIYYSTDGNTPTTSSNVYTGPISLTAGKVVYKAMAVDGNGIESSVATRTYTGIAPVALPFSWAKGTTRETINSTTGVSQTGLSSDYADNDYKLKFDGDDDNIIIYTDEKPVKVTIGVKMIGGASTSKFSIQESTNGSEFTEVEKLTISGSQNDVVNLETTKVFAATTRVIKLNFIKGSNVGVGPVTILGGSVPATLNASGYATYASTYPLDFSDDSEFSAWQIKSVTGDAITFEQVTGAVAVGTGVLLKGTASEAINIPVAASGDDISSTNKLEGITKATSIAADKYYGLSGESFVKVSAGTVPAGKALLPASIVDSTNSRLVFVFEGTQGISHVEDGGQLIDNAVYNLNGQRVNSPKKGLYIVNGKKVVMK